MALGYWVGLARRAGISIPDGLTMNFFKSATSSDSRKVPKILQNGGEVISHFVDKTITTAQVLALNATPIELVAAPGADKALILTGATLFYDFNSAAYAGIAAGEELVIRYTDGSGAIASTIETTGFLDQSDDQIRFSYPASVNALTPVVNAAFVAHILVGEIITGDSPILFRVFYNVMSTNLS